MARVTRRQLIALAAAGALAGGFRFGHQRVARPAAPSGPLSQEALALIERAWAGLDPARVLDSHVHVVGLGCGGTGCEVGERLRSALNPLESLKFSIYLEASGVNDLTRADQQYIERLAGLIKSQSPHGRALLFAFDHVYDQNGQLQQQASEFFTPNAYVASLVKASPELFVACASVHPYRVDAVEALRRRSPTARSR